MRNLIMIFTILLLVSCNKEERKIYDKWIATEYWNKESPTMAFEKCDGCVEVEVDITKDSWYPLIEGEVYIGENNTLIESDPDRHYTYQYYEKENKLILNAYHSYHYYYVILYRK